jgi:hypothetical protein
MKYTRSAVLSRHATPALLGQYERQLYPALLEAVTKAGFAIDIGHAEGYYAVGLALLGMPVVAFDADWHERRVCRAMARANGVLDRISLRRWCTEVSLRVLTRDRRALIISDADGGEIELFTPQMIRDLRHCDLIVELLAPTAEQNEPFVRRFLSTHRVEIIEHPTEPAGVETIAFLGPHAPRMATEYRAFQQWMVARAK